MKCQKKNKSQKKQKKKKYMKTKNFQNSKTQNPIDVNVRQCQCHIMSGSSYMAESHNAKVR